MILTCVEGLQLDVLRFQEAVCVIALGPVYISPISQPPSSPPSRIRDPALVSSPMMTSTQFPSELVLLYLLAVVRRGWYGHHHLSTSKGLSLSLMVKCATEVHAGLQWRTLYGQMSAVINRGGQDYCLTDTIPSILMSTPLGIN